jgi:hypothetical protein
VATPVPPLEHAPCPSPPRHRHAYVGGGPTPSVVASRTLRTDTSPMTRSTHTVADCTRPAVRTFARAASVEVPMGDTGRGVSVVIMRISLHPSVVRVTERPTTS